MNIKHVFFSKMLTALISSALLMSAAHAAYILDNKIGEANLASSADAVELAAMEGFVSTLLGTPTTLTQDLKLDAADSGFNIQANGTGQWYIDVAPTEPGYFLLKFGTGGTSATADSFFFQNIGEMTKLVFSNEQVQNLVGGTGRTSGIGRLSHYVTYGSTTEPPCTGPSCNPSIPEPASLLLMSAGLVGFGLARRRKSE